MLSERIVFFGRNQHFDITKICFQILVEHILKSPHRILFTVVSDDSHQDKDSLQSIAEHNGIKWMSLPNDDVNNPHFLDFIRAKNPTLFITVQFPTIFRKELLKIPKKASLNIHKGWPLRGGAVNERAIYYQLSKYNIILHHMDSGIDTGNIIAKVGFALSPKENGYSLIKKINKTGSKLFRKHFLPLLGKPIPKGTRQNIKKTIYAQKGSLSNVINFNCHAKHIERLCRSFYHPGKEGASILLKKSLKLKITPPVKIINRKTKFLPGTIISIAPGKLVVASNKSSVVFCQGYLKNNHNVDVSQVIKNYRYNIGDRFTSNILENDRNK